MTKNYNNYSASEKRYANLPKDVLNYIGKPREVPRCKNPIKPIHDMHLTPINRGFLELKVGKTSVSLNEGSNKLTTRTLTGLAKKIPNDLLDYLDREINHEYYAEKNLKEKIGSIFNTTICISSLYVTSYLSSKMITDFQNNNSLEDFGKLGASILVGLVTGYKFNRDFMDFDRSKKVIDKRKSNLSD